MLSQPTVELNEAASAKAVWITAYVLKSRRGKYRVSLTNEPDEQGWEVVEENSISLESSTDVSALSAEVDRVCEEPLTHDEAVDLLARIRGHVPLTNDPMQRTGIAISPGRIAFRFGLLLLVSIYHDNLFALAVLLLLDSTWRTVSVFADDRSTDRLRRLHVISLLATIAVVATLATCQIGVMLFLVIVLVAVMPWEIAIWWEKRNRKLSGTRQPEATGPA